MIYEFRTYTLHPGTLAEFLKRFGDALPGRERFSRLAAFWYTDVGPLNQVIHVWPYENALERSRIRSEAVKARSWPPDTGSFIAEMRSEIFEPAPFCPPLDASNFGPIFEMSTCLLKPFAIGATIENWKNYVHERTKLSPLIGIFASDIGGLNQLVQIWPYKNFDERAAIRTKGLSAGIWPPPENAATLKEESKLLRAAQFSPIK